MYTVNYVKPWMFSWCWGGGGGIFLVNDNNNITAMYSYLAGWDTDISQKLKSETMRTKRCWVEASYLERKDKFVS